MSNGHFVSYGGGIHHSAIIGQAPEGREWRPADPEYSPVVERSARIEAFVTVDSGMGRPTYIGAKVWLMKRVHVGHDAVILDDCELAPGVIVGGHAWIGTRCKLGMGAIVLPCVRIGCGARIGAGAVVTRDVPAGETWAGNPARNLQGLPREAAQRACAGMGV